MIELSLKDIKTNIDNANVSYLEIRDVVIKSIGLKKVIMLDSLYLN